MKKEIKISICKPNKQITSWHILEFEEPNIWYPIAYFKKAKYAGKDFEIIMNYLAKINL